MAVDPVLVRHGIGSLRLTHALRTLPLPICLYTFQANAGARRFYERHGFVAIAFIDGQANEEHCPDVLCEVNAHETRPEPRVDWRADVAMQALRYFLPFRPAGTIDRLALSL